MSKAVNLVKRTLIVVAVAALISLGVIIAYGLYVGEVSSIRAGVKLLAIAGGLMYLCDFWSKISAKTQAKIG